MNTDIIKSVLFGVAIGDALGVPVEFENREYLRNNPITDMIGYGTHNQPPGTFSDDSSLTFCLADALTNRFDLRRVGNNLVKWNDNNFWTARGNVFDVGIATKKAIDRLRDGVKPDLAGGVDEYSNGNGSLMRIAPLLFYLLNKPTEQRFKIIKQVSSITHRHIRSIIACFYYLEFARLLYEGIDKYKIYRTLQADISGYLNSINLDPEEISEYDRLLNRNIYDLYEDDIYSDGYVVHTLEASIWSLMTTSTFKAAVLKSVNLGEDSDTTGAVTGGLAGLLYGIDSIPKIWIRQIARNQEIKELAKRLGNRYANN
jgi:ADP-ribosyl-[dinitrogen reductase] hydrolase